MTTTIEVLQPEIVGAELVKVEQQAGLAEDAAVALRHEYENHYNDICKWREQALTITDPENVAHQKLAGIVRRGLKSVRCDVERVRKSLKEDSLKRGKAIDGYANVLKYLCEPIEEKLFEIEQYVERKEAARIAALAQERQAALIAVECDPTPYNLGVMDEATFSVVLKNAKDAQAAKIEAARKAEADRIAVEQARIAEEARIRAENAKLKAEADAREATMKAEREKAAKKQAEIEAKARKEREAAEAKAKKEKAEADAKLKAERDAREKAEREAAEAKRKEQDRVEAEKRTAEAKAKAERDAAAKAARAPDREKIIAFATTLVNLPIPAALASAEATRLAYSIGMKVDELAQWIKGEAGKL